VHIFQTLLPLPVSIIRYQIHQEKIYRANQNKSTQSIYANTPKQNENENAKKLGAIGIGAVTRPTQGISKPN
jgi:hypothetical protein